jgi:predicted transglutaminase-like cysteine proteinase
MPSSKLVHFWLLAISLILAALALLDTVAPARAEKIYPSLLNTTESPSRRLQPFQKWNDMLERQVNERSLYDGPCNARRFNRCHLQEWRALLAGLAGKDRMSQLAAVNEFMNRAPYIEDMPNWGVPDYWATPLQFLTKDGDCEDYAIAKFVSLRTLGFSNDELRIAVVDDANLQQPHAVLVVYVDGQALVLDNQIPQIVPSSVIKHYRPIYSINEDTWWLHTAR